MGDTSYGHVILRAVHQHEWDLRVRRSYVVISWWKMHPRGGLHLTSHTPKKSALQGEEREWGDYLLIL